MNDDDMSGLPPSHVDKIRKMLAFLQDMGREDELRTIPGWRPHRLAGARRGTWSLSVTRNWRITFRVDRTTNAITQLDFEDYH